MNPGASGRGLHGAQSRIFGHRAVEVVFSVTPEVTFVTGDQFL